MGFHNPYHFVPVFRRTAEQKRDDLAIGGLRSPEGVSHARYAPDTYSGELTCQITAETPLLIGSVQPTREDRARGNVLVKGYTADGKPSSTPAIPASSLRGLISSVAEAASESALRVLGREVNGKPCYSYRQSPDSALSAVGRLHNTPDGWKLEPITLPQLPHTNGEIRLEGADARWRSVYNRPALRVYIAEGDHQTWNGKREDVWQLPLADVQWADGEHSRIAIAPAALKLVASGIPNIRNVISQLTAPPFQQPVECPRATRPNWTKGVIRVMGHETFPSKHFELFLPYDPDDGKARNRLLPVSGSAVERFEMLAYQRWDATKDRQEPILPHALKGSRRDRGRGELKLADGDLVYFDVNEDGTEVNCISFSAIWRGRVEEDQRTAATAWHFFAAADPDLAPMHGRARGVPERTAITIAEQMFGFVEERAAENEGDEGTGLALRGRLRFSDALAQGDVRFGPEVELRLLNGPKPPSPAMYFKTTDARGDGHIAKKILNPELHSPQGRKFYLHDPGANELEPWKHDDDRDGEFDRKMQVKARPIPKDSVFTFRIRFDNLSRRELGLLLYSLRPAPEFRHKIGMGKGIGLGSVAIQVCGLRLVDRQARYTSEGWLSARDRDATAEVKEIQREWRDSMRAETRLSLETLGNPAKVTAEISTPVTQAQQRERKRTETYAWFVENERRARRNLKALERNKFQLPELPAL